MSWSGIPYAIEAILGERKKRDEIRDKAMKKLRASTTGDRTMSEIEEKALALVNEKRGDNYQMSGLRGWGVIYEALCRAIERHEADEAAHVATVEGILTAHEAFKQEVSDAVECTKFMVETHCDTEALELVSNRLNRFIIPKPTVDPLAEVLDQLNVGNGWDDTEDYARRVYEVLAKRGLKIVETGQ